MQTQVIFEGIILVLMEDIDHRFMWDGSGSVGKAVVNEPQDW